MSHRFIRPTGGLQNYTSLYVRGNGANGSTLIKDESPKYKAITLAGTTQISTSQKRFGTGSILFDGDSDYFSVPSGSDFDVGSGAFTCGFWIYLTNNTIRNDFVSSGTSDYKWWGILTSDNPNTLKMVASSNGTSWDIAAAGSTAITANAWHYILVNRSGTALRAYLDGTLELNITTSSSINNSSTAVYFGHFPAAVYYWMHGYMDDIIFYKGIALDGTVVPKRSLI